MGTQTKNEAPGGDLGIQTKVTPPLTILVNGETAKVNLDLAHSDGSVRLQDEIAINLRHYGLGRNQGESPVDYLRRVRETFVYHTPNADGTPETLR